MADISYESLELLAQIVIKNIKEEFQVKHLSKNLINTIEVQASPEKIEIIIPAQTYNMLLFQTKGVVVHTGHGSYASKLDKEGSSFRVYPHGTRKGSHKIKPGNHKDFVERVIEESISEWTMTLQNYKVSKITKLGE